MGFMLEKKTAPVTDRYEGGGVGKHGRFKRIPGEAEAQHKEKMEKLFFFSKITFLSNFLPSNDFLVFGLSKIK